MNTKKQKEQNDTQKNLWQIPDPKSYGLAYFLFSLVVVGFIYLYFFSAINQLDAPLFKIRVDSWPYIKEAFKGLLTLEGDYWSLVKNFYIFFGMLGFFYESGKLVLRGILKLFSNSNSLSCRPCPRQNHSGVNSGKDPSNHPNYKSLFENSIWIYVPVILSIGTFNTSLLWLILGGLGILNKTLAITFTLCGFAAFIYRVYSFWCHSGLSRIDSDFPQKYKTRFRNFIDAYIQLPRLEKFLSALLIVWMISWIFRAFIMEVFVDSLVYQLGLPWHYIIEGRIFTNPYNSFSYMSQNMEMLFLNPLLLNAEPVTKMLSWLFWSMTISLIFGTVQLFGGSFFGLVGSCLFAFVPATFWQTTIAKNDNASGFYMLLAYLLYAQFFAADKDQRKTVLLFLCGLVSGFSIGTKYSGLVPAAQLGMLLPVFLYAFSKPVIHSFNLTEAIKHILIFVSGLLISYAPWAIKNIYTTGNPLYPYLNNLFHADLLRPWHQGLDTESGRILGLQGYQDFFSYWLGVKIGDFGRTLGVLGWFVILTPLTLFIKNKWVKIFSLLTLSGWFLISWFTLTTRYQIAFIASFLLLSAIWLNFFKKNDILKVLLLSILTVSIFSKSVWISWVNEAFFSVRGVTTGLFQGEFFETGYQDEVEDLIKFYSESDKVLPQDAKVLLIAEHRIYKFPRKFIAKSFVDKEPIVDMASNIKTSEELKAVLVQNGITHIFINVENWNNYATANGKDNPQFFNAVQEFLVIKAQRLIGLQKRNFYLLKV